ncbi:Trp biosynthesis-associated membrane protein [Nocardioides insulae]|uniref:Trp biosynthesis-associated membrane protein n=1 Tax=Nocardioides insulae TaxID=394734 RepID=UPI00041BF4B8|nr:Trp biosynthesis-associated membrane protein [Nocardioides insulae]
MAERSRRRTFGPVVLLGLAGGGLAALAGTKAWAEPVSGPNADSTALDLAQLAGTVPGDVPLAGALGLVALASWGVILVTRGLVRRLVAGLAALASLGVLATVVDAWLTLPDEVVDASAAVGAAGIEADWTLWIWAALVGGLVGLLAAVAAVRLAPDWPEMGRKYDAPAAAAAAAPTIPVEERHSLDLWKALDQGDDPTESSAPTEDEEGTDTQTRSGADPAD